jgi:hypothetical protein
MVMVLVERWPGLLHDKSLEDPQLALQKLSHVLFVLATLVFSPTLCWIDNIVPNSR